MRGIEDGTCICSPKDLLLYCHFFLRIPHPTLIINEVQILDIKLFLMSFGMLFLAELGDKTQLAVFTLVTQYKKPLPIFLGSSLALVLVTLIGALFGGVVSRYVPPAYLKLGAGILFVGIGIFVLLEAVPGVVHQLSRG